MVSNMSMGGRPAMPRHASLARRPDSFVCHGARVGRCSGPAGPPGEGPSKTEWPANQAGMAGRPPMYMIYYIFQMLNSI